MMDGPALTILMHVWWWAFTGVSVGINLGVHRCVCAMRLLTFDRSPKRFVKWLYPSALSAAECAGCSTSSPVLHASHVCIAAMLLGVGMALMTSAVENIFMWFWSPGYSFYLRERTYFLISENGIDSPTPFFLNWTVGSFLLVWLCMWILYQMHLLGTATPYVVEVHSLMGAFRRIEFLNLITVSLI